MNNAKKKKQELDIVGISPCTLKNNHFKFLNVMPSNQAQIHTSEELFLTNEKI